MNTTDAERLAWAAAFGLWTVGDLATTAIGLRLGAVEQAPMAAETIAQSGTAGLLPHKLAALALFGGLFAAARPLCRWTALGVPLGLALLGAVATANNAAVIVAVISA